MPIARIRENIHMLGWANGLLYMLHRSLSALTAGRVRIVRYELVAQPVPQDGEDTIRTSPKQTIGFVDRDAPIVKAFPRPESVVANRFKNGDLCIAAYTGDDFSGFLWLARSHYEEDEVRCLFKLGASSLSAWDYDVYVEPRYRIGRTFARLWQTANQYMKEQHILWSFSRISAFNSGSLQAHRRLGIKKVGHASFLCLGKTQVMISNLAPFFHVSLSDKSRPTILLDAPGNP